MDLLTPYEVEYIVQGLGEISVKDYAGKKWFSQHEALYKLNLQSHRNAKAREDEYVLDSMVTFDKIKVLIHNLIVSETWKLRVLPLCIPEILALSSVRSYNLVSSIQIYHEAIICNFISILLYHRTACNEAGDYLIDLIDWCYRKLIKLNTRTEETEERSTGEQDYNTQINELDFAMGIESLSIIRFISDHLKDFSLSVVQQLVEQCDIFCILVPLMETKPWKKNTKAGKMVYENQQWQKSKDIMKIPKAEAQIWLTIYNLFMNFDVRNKYELNSYRKQNLLRLRKFINEVVIDQITVLGDLLRALEELGLMPDSLPSKISAFVIQQLPELQDKISCNQNWEEIAAYHKENYLVESLEEQKASMELMMKGIDDILEEPICAECGNLATNRCSKCHHEWYCSRKCQVSAWKKHKQICELLGQPDTHINPETNKKTQKITDVTEN